MSAARPFLRGVRREVRALCNAKSSRFSRAGPRATGLKIAAQEDSLSCSPKSSRVSSSACTDDLFRRRGQDEGSGRCSDRGTDRGAGSGHRQPDRDVRGEGKFPGSFPEVRLIDMRVLPFVADGATCLPRQKLPGRCGRVSGSGFVVFGRAYHVDRWQSEGASTEASLQGEASAGLAIGRCEEEDEDLRYRRSTPQKSHPDHAVLREEPVGLFGYAELKTPEGFHRMAEEAVARSDALIDELRCTPPSAATIRLMDEISDSVCTVLDAAELCRNTHPDREYVAAANEAFVQLSRYVQKLNMSTELYGALKAAMDAGGELTEEARRVGAMLRMDFERGGVHLADDRRAYVEELNNEITRLGMQFGHTISTDPSFVDICPASKLKAVPENIRAMLRPLWKAPDGTVQDAPGGGKGKRGHATPPAGYRVGAQAVVLSGLLKWVQDSQVRETIYVAGNSTPKANLAVLQQIIDARHELAQVLGFATYAEFQTAPLLAGSPQRVVSFLDTLSQQIRPKADEELTLLAEYKRSQEGGTPGGTTIHAWDTAFYTGLAKARAHSLDARVVAAYFPLERCVEGLGLLLRSLFGMRMCQLAMPPGEAWAPDVRKYAITHPDEGDMGHIYLDIYPRPSKYTHAAHFTLKCGRRKLDSSYQLPVVALVCNFPRPLEGGPCLLGHAEVETLFHEFGHALHSLLSRTEFQHLSGTRAALDFVETPSNLLEYFAGDYRVLKHFARHHSSGDPIPEKLVTALRHSKTMFAARDLQSQIIFALGDQALFGRQPLPGGTTAVLAAIQDQHSSVRHVAGTHWESRFSHLMGYGAGYYSYLYAKCFAAQIWHTHLAEDPLSREAGDRLRLQMLRHGGARDPSLILSDLLPDFKRAVGPQGHGVEPCTSQMLKEVGL